MFPSNLMKRTNFPNMAGRARCDDWIGGNCGCPEPKGGVSCYHVDSQEGLNLLVKSIMKYQLEVKNEN